MLLLSFLSLYIHIYKFTSIYIHHTCIKHTSNIHACMHASIHPYIHTYIHAYIHTYVRTYLHTYIHKHINIHINIYIQKYIYNKYIYIYFLIYRKIKLTNFSQLNHCSNTHETHCKYENLLFKTNEMFFRKTCLYWMIIEENKTIQKYFQLLAEWAKFYLRK